MKPHAWQTQAAEDFARLGGVYVGLDPGAGKTYAAALIAAQARRPLVVAPAAAVAQTMAMFESYGVERAKAKDGLLWGFREGVAYFASYTWLTREAQADFIARFAPDVVLMDEYHMARGLGHSARRRIERELVTRPEVRVGVFTGSPTGGDPRDLAWGLRWALRGHVRGLVPRLDSGIEPWAEALDASESMRDGFRVALLATPGVYLDVGSVGAYPGRVDFTIIRRDPVMVLSDEWQLPDGYFIDSPAYAAEVSRMMAWGWWPRRDRRPSDAYLAARAGWSKTVRRVIESGAADTEAQVRRLRPEAYAAWAEVEAAEGDLGESVPEWGQNCRLRLHALVGDRTPRMDRPMRRTIVWADHRALQDLAGAELGVSVFREGGRDARGRYLPDVDDTLVVASIDACHQALNLQHFNDNLVLEPPADAEKWKQLIGRTARQGQPADSVSVRVVVNCTAAAHALRTAIDKAERIRSLTGKGNPLLQLKEW